MTVPSESNESSDASVKVAVRIRPQNARERMQMNQICASVTPNEPQIYIGKDKAFTYDYVFNIVSKQDEIFNTLAKPLIDGCLEGYNATILAYGQTGSGKTFTMGSGFDVSLDSIDVGIIPRGVQYLFNRIEKIKMDYKKKMLPVPDFKIVAQFLELYNEELIDLLDIHDGKDKKSHIKIHENTGGSIYLTGVSTRLVSSLEDTLKCLKDGTSCRSTASTNMNSASSRSHAIFTLHIKQQRLIDSNLDENTNGESETDYETLTAKFHFVDLAGSERLKRTGATGERAKEGISINCGLLALGNVISTLGDKNKRGCHVPYRNSKLTRLLQDSLGGNSQTIMIACISPSDCDFLETLNTLNYANRARNIKNKLTINQDKTSKQLAAMRIQIESLQAELLEYKQGKRSADSKEEGGYSDIYTENNILQSENQGLRLKIKALYETIESLKARNAQVLAEKEAFNWQMIKQNNNCLEVNILDLESEEIMKVIEKYTLEVEGLRAKLAEAEAMVSVLQRSSTMSSTVEFSKHSHVSMSGEFPDDESVFESTMCTEWDSFMVHTKRKKTKKTEVCDIENGSTFICSISETGDTNPPLPSASSDVDKDSLNGDAEEISNAEDSYDDDDDSDAENQDAENYLHQSLATLSTEIDVKKRLISELQTKQKQLKKIREHYESQLEALQNKIKETEHERDQVLANLGEVEVSNEERVRKVKNEYEKKLSELKSELNQLQTAKREHTIMLKNQQRKDHELRLLQKELNDLKGMKVQLSKKLREETKRTRVVETTRNKEIVQLRKEKRIADNQIRNLEQEKVRKNQILKRKQEEVEALRRRQTAFSTNTSKFKQVAAPSHSYTPVSDKSTLKSQSKPIPKNHARRHSLLAKLTKSKWNSIENALKKTIIRRQTINSFEQDMNTRVREREKLGIKYQKLENRRIEYVKEGKNTDEIVYEMKNIKSQIECVQEDISECQTNILEVEESQLEESVSDIIATCSLDEAQYLLEQVYQLAINKGILAQTLEIQETSLKFQLETKSQEREQALDMLRIALQHSTVPFDMDGIFANESDDEDDCEESPMDTEIPGSVNNQSRNSGSFNFSFQNSDNKKPVSKRKPATPEELLGVNKTVPDKSSLSFNFENNNNSSLTSIIKRNIHTAQTPTETSRGLLINTPDNWKDSSTGDENKSKSSKNNFVNPKSLVRRQLTWKHPGGSMTTSLIVSRNNTDDDIPHFSTAETPPTSPLNFRRVLSQRSHNQENVFKRLTTTRTSPNPTRGTISTISKKSPLSTHVPLQCVSIADGHQKAILDLDVSENILLTGSKDRCAKIWDLTKMVEIGSLTEHQNSVTKVRYSSLTNLAFTVSTFYIKMWDIRDSKKCIRTLWSSGLSQEGPPEFPQTSRQTVCPPGENFIMDIAFSNSGNTMFLATANSVKLWDMRRYCAVGKLHGNHQAPVMVLAASDKDRCSSTLVTGSKDHYIKVFEVSPGSVGLITPSVELQPPHYDGVESLALYDQVLLSGSRDACIKKWDLTTGQPIASFSQAHRDWIQALCFTSDKIHFLSGCRSGVIKLWNTENCAYIGDVQAHESGITVLKSSSDHIFSASSDCKMKIWRRNLPNEC